MKKMITEDLIIEIKADGNKIVYLSYDIMRISEFVDLELVLQLFEDIGTHLKVYDVIKEFNIFIERR